MDNGAVERELPHAPVADLPPVASAPSTAIPNIDGLLDGLDADDFFDEDDDFNDCGALSGASIAPHAQATSDPSHVTAPPPRSASHVQTNEDEHDELYIPAEPLPAHIPATVSFATARGKAIAPPSDAAMSRALKLMREAEREMEEEPTKRRRTESPSSTPRPQKQEPQTAPDTPTAAPPPLPSTGFQLGSGRAAPPPSASSVARAMALFGDTDTTPSKPSGAFIAQASTGSAGPVPNSESRARALSILGDVDMPSRPPSSPIGGGIGFQLGSGRAVAPPNADSMARALSIFGEADSHSAPAASSGFSLGSGRSAPPPSSESMGHALAIFGEADSHAGPSTSRDPTVFRAPLATSTPTRPGSPAFTAPRPIRSFSTPNRPSTPTRTPLQTTTNTFGAGTSTPQPPKLPKGIDIRTPGATPRRIGLGATPSSAKRGARKGFVTPFKTPGAAGGRKPLVPSGLRAPPIAKPVTPEKIFSSVFDLERPQDRTSMRAAFLYPGYYHTAELREMGLPDEIWLINLDNAIDYQFIGEDASTLGNGQAFERLKLEGCDLVTPKWVDNHWRLILWKIAGQVMAKPTLFDEKWNWYEVMCQLKYRYEREFGAAQRPIVRRIQEHDSSPSLPIVLCVSGVHRPPPVLNEKDEPVPQRPYLDLTDGWYHIRAVTDDCLARAVSSGKIKVGRKLGISGAKLESGSDGADVFEAFEKSHLILSGNSTHLAPWDAKLGAQAKPFIAGLSCLSVDGGNIVLMDIVLERVFPLAYVNGDRTSREGPWNEDEEALRADAWKDKYEAESTRMQDEMWKNLEKIEDLASLLASHAEDASGPVSDTPPDSVDNDFDDLLEAANPMARLRSLSSSHVVHLARHARIRLEQAAAEERSELECRLQEICPPRDIRDFRMVRFKDAREGSKEAARTGLLSVWDARALGDELKEGRRYLVSNLIPGRNGDWSVPKRGGSKTEVYLHTRRDTRWKAVDRPAKEATKAEDEL